MKLRASAFSLAALFAALFVTGPARAQESVQKKLDECINTEQHHDSAAGAILGFLSHFSFSRSSSVSTSSDSGNNNNQKSSGGLGVATDTAAGGAMGLATAYFKAMADCLGDHPDWLPASQLETSADYKTAVAQANYDSSQGIVLKPEAVNMPAEARPETRFQVRSRFLVLTPDGAETAVQISRKLIAVADGVEQAITIPAPAEEQRTLSAGEHEDVVNLLIPKDAPLGVVYRVEFSVGAPKQAGTSVSGSVKVL